MKKVLSVIVAAIMLAAMIPAAVSASTDYVSPGNIIVPYSNGNIVIDGVLSEGEWSETYKLQLNSTNLRSWTAGAYEGPIDFYYSWDDDFLYTAAVVSDPNGIFSPIGNITNSRFQIALNPAAMIAPLWEGLFFSMAPAEDSDLVTCYRHNFEASDPYSTVGCEEDQFFGKYTIIYDDNGVRTGWMMEAKLSWDVIASYDRWNDIDLDGELELTKFSPRDEVRGRAFCTATITYVQVIDDPGNPNTGRTAKNGKAGIFTVDSYDVVLFFALPEEIESRDTETVYFTAEKPDDDETDATETQKEPASSETEDESKDTKAADTAKETKAESTDSGKQEQPANNTGLIIGIIIGVVVVCAGVVVGIVLSKKKKAK